MKFEGRGLAEEKNLLMIAYFFPPIGGSGAMRPLKLAKYLPQNGWNPMVLTVSNPDWYYADDPDLLSELPSKVSVQRTRMIRSAWVFRLLNPFRTATLDKWIRRYLLHPDDQIGWIPFAYRAGIKLASKKPIRAIYSTSAPMSGHLIAYFIKKKTGLPWIADFRDEWYENPDLALPTALHRRFHYRLEKKVVDAADHIVTAASGFCRLLSKHPGAGSRCSTVYMGFDPRDFLPDDSVDQESSGSGRAFTIAFSGLFYGSFRPVRVFSAIHRCIEQGEIPPDRIRALFIGANSPPDIGVADRYGICRFTGFLPHRQALDRLRLADVLLLLLSRERGDSVVPSKTFEYIACGKPILAVVPADSEVAGIIHKTRTGRVVDFEDEAGIGQAVLALYRQWSRRGPAINPDANAISFFDQRNQARRLAALLDQVAAPGGRQNTEGDR